MSADSLIARPSVWLASTSIAVAMALGCSSSSGGGSPGAPSDSGAASDVVGDGPRDGAAPDALYGACALHGSFGWPCHLATSGADPTDCTDPGYTECFVGGQGAWCTKTCTGNGDCTTGVGDAGCIPVSCNARGYCK